MKNKIREEKAITLVALIITIIVLLILAMVSIRLVMNDGIIGKAEKSTNDYSTAEEKEQIQLGYKEYQMAQFSGETPVLKVEGAKKVEAKEGGGWTVTFPSEKIYDVTEGGIISDSNETSGNNASIEFPDGTIKSIEEYAGKTWYEFATDINNTESYNIQYDTTYNKDLKEIIVERHNDEDEEAFISWKIAQLQYSVIVGNLMEKNGDTVYCSSVIEPGHTYVVVFIAY